MTAQVIPARTTGPAQTEWTDSTAAAHQVLMEHAACERGNRSVRDNITTPIFCMSSRTTMFTSEWEPIKSGVFSSDWQSLEKGKRQALSLWLSRPRRNQKRIIYSCCWVTFNRFPPSENVSISSFQFISLYKFNCQRADTWLDLDILSGTLGMWLCPSIQGRVK